MLIIALLVLVAMTMAGIALMRSVDSATLVAGNMAFRQSATASADRGMEIAFNYLRGVDATVLVADAAGSGYHATIPAPDVDFTGNATVATTDDVDWSGPGVKVVTGSDAAGNSVAYIIHRLCRAGTVALNPVSCTTWQGPSSDDDDLSIGADASSGRDSWIHGNASPPRGLYRVTVRTKGPRNTYSYVQAIVVI